MTKEEKYWRSPLVLIFHLKSMLLVLGACLSARSPQLKGCDKMFLLPTATRRNLFLIVAIINKDSYLNL